jgi:hypothetical protein
MTGTGKDYLGPQSVTDVGRMLMALMSEVWILRDRQMITEHLLAEKGLLTSEEIDRFAVPAELAARIEAERDRFARLILSAPIAAEARSIPEILERAGMPEAAAAAAGAPR